MLVSRSITVIMCDQCKREIEPEDYCIDIELSDYIKVSTNNCAFKEDIENPIHAAHLDFCSKECMASYLLGE